MKYRVIELLASELLKPDLLIAHYNPHAPALPLDWPSIAADIIVQLAEDIRSESPSTAGLK